MKKDPKDLHSSEKTALAIYKSFDCTQYGVGEMAFVETAGKLIYAYGQYVNGEKSDSLWAAIASWNEEKERALREAKRVADWRKCATGLARAVRCGNMELLAETLAEFDQLNK